MRYRYLTVVLAALTLVAGACTNGGSSSASGAGQKVSLDFWVFKEAQDQYFNDLVAAFEKQNPNIVLNVTAFPEESYGTKVDTALAAGNPPDLGLSSGVETMRSGVLLPLIDMVQQYGIDLTRFNPAIVVTSDQLNAAY